MRRSSRLAQNLAFVLLPLAIMGLMGAGVVLGVRDCFVAVEPVLQVPPSDERLAEDFADQREAYERMRESFDSVDLGRVGLPGAQGWYVTVSRGGAGVMSSWERGYVYCESTLPVDEGEYDGVGSSYSHLQGNWYIWRFDDP